MVDYTYSLKYQRKIKEFIQCADLLGIRMGEILQEYQNQLFYDSKVSKYELFSSMIEESKVDDHQAEYLSSWLSELKKFKDKRSESEYALDLILGWLTEDCVLKFLNTHGVTCHLSGRDSDREFSQANNIKRDSDLVIIKGKDQIHLEVVCDWTGFWFRNNSLELRYNKYYGLLESKSLLLGMSISDQKGFLLNFADDDPSSWVRLEKYPPFGGKPASRLTNIRSKLAPVHQVLNEIVLAFKASS